MYGYMQPGVYLKYPSRGCLVDEEVSEAAIGMAPYLHFDTKSASPGAVCCPFYS